MLLPTPRPEPALVFAEVLDAAGARSGRCDRLSGQPVGPTLVPTAAVLGTVGRPGQFDLTFRPLQLRSKDRWDRLARHMSSGRPVPPVRLQRIGALYFVVDGHHRVSVARALGRRTIAATIQPVCTVAAVDVDLRRDLLRILAAERDFLHAVPLPDAATAQLGLTHPADYSALAHTALAWCRAHGLHPVPDEPLSAAAAETWWNDIVLGWADRTRTARGAGHKVAAAYFAAQRWMPRVPDGSV